jgi:putative FmdB family regulatory protein
MPIYEYKCQHCGEKFEAQRKMTDGDSELKCPKCGQKQPRRVFSTFSCTGSSGQSCTPSTSHG